MTWDSLLTIVPERRKVLRWRDSKAELKPAMPPVTEFFTNCQDVNILVRISKARCAAMWTTVSNIAIRPNQWCNVLIVLRDNPHSVANGLWRLESTRAAKICRVDSVPERLRKVATMLFLSPQSTDLTWSRTLTKK
ncbi:hypothetical protein MPH_13694 [Macrophomina phaseolina MS6]|uniref:Uncharacterized protein n=1 Tax=Macrophomina phaseolina (strain MS6) TaxID=1126212 RepID=K2QHL3_MACPH|nr:hypothetical protein MPH_13694 [Macrophomina phaseolina MS6]